MVELTENEINLNKYIKFLENLKGFLEGWTAGGEALSPRDAGTLYMAEMVLKDIKKFQGELKGVFENCSDCAGTGGVFGYGKNGPIEAVCLKCNGLGELKTK